MPLKLELFQILPFFGYHSPEKAMSAMNAFLALDHNKASFSETQNKANLFVTKIGGDDYKFFLGSLILIATGISYTNTCQVVDVSTSTKCASLQAYPLSLEGATGGVVNGSPLICGGISGAG